MELIQVGSKTYYIKNNTNIGIYKVDNNNIYLIDTGNDKDCGKKILKIINENNWNILGIINTHSNADHIGGNKVIQDRTNCKILSYGIEKSFIEYPILEPSFLYGGYPFKDIKNKFLYAKESRPISISNNLPEGLEYFSLKGHFYDMIGIKTSDNIYFIADSLFSEETINKYHIFYIYNVEEYLNSLDYLNTLKGTLYIPSHNVATKDISNLININRKKIEEISSYICNICNDYISLEDILDNIFNKYKININITQYILIKSTIKSYLSYLYDNNKIIYKFINNKLMWKKNTDEDI